MYMHTFGGFFRQALQPMEQDRTVKSNSKRPKPIKTPA